METQLSSHLLGLDKNNDNIRRERLSQPLLGILLQWTSEHSQTQGALASLQLPHKTESEERQELEWSLEFWKCLCVEQEAWQDLSCWVCSQQKNCSCAHTLVQSGNTESEVQLGLLTSCADKTQSNLKSYFI